MTKITNKIALEIALSTIDHAVTNGATLEADYEGGFEEVKTKLAKMIEQLDKKSSTPKKPTKTQLANETLKDSIVEALAVAPQALTVSELIASTPTLAGLATQKVSPLLSKLVADGKVERLVEKNRAYFKVK